MPKITKHEGTDTPGVECASGTGNCGEETPEKCLGSSSNPSLTSPENGQPRSENLPESPVPPTAPISKPAPRVTRSAGSVAGQTTSAYRFPNN
jgi:hypothetical protein